MGNMKTPWYTKAKALMATRHPKVMGKDIAEALNVTPSAAGHYLSGRRSPTVEQVQVIARVLGVSMSELVGEDPFFITEKQERELISKARELKEEEIEEIMQIIDFKLQRQQSKQ